MNLWFAGCATLCSIFLTIFIHLKTHLFYDHMFQVADYGNSNEEKLQVKNVQLSKETLDAMLDGLGKIRDQLSSVVSR